jgi:hypothetical protein
MFNPEVKTESEIFWVIPDGKPSYRGQIDRPAAKGDSTLFYYATRLLVERHKFSPSQKSSARKEEILFSSHRKKMTALENVIELYISSLIMAFSMEELGLSKHHAMQLSNLMESFGKAKNDEEPLPDLHLGLDLLSNIVLGEPRCRKAILDIKKTNQHEIENVGACLFEDELIDVLDEIYQQYPQRKNKRLGISEYILTSEFKQKSEIHFHKTLLWNLGIDLEHDYPSPNLSLSEECVYYSDAVQLELMKRQGLRFSDFCKEDVFSDFFAKLSSQGPAIFRGTFGKYDIGDSIIEMPETHHGRSVHYWESKPGSTLKTIPNPLMRPIVVVGAKKDDNKKDAGTVYYYHPDLKSSSGLPKKTPVFSMSYDVFIAQCIPMQKEKPIAVVKNKI